MSLGPTVVNRRRPVPLSVLVTGASGFVGRHVVRELAARRHTVVATHCDPPDRLPPRAPGVKWVRWDATRGSLPRVRWDCVQAILHMALPGDVFGFPGNAHDLFETQVASTFRLLEAARIHKLQRVVVASTGYVLGTRTEPHRETDEGYSPSTFYGTTKACAELLARGYAGIVPTAVARFYWPYGPGGERYVVQRLMQRIAEERPVYVEGRKGMLMNPVWVEDLARGVAQCLESTATGIFHLAGPEILTMRQLIWIMADILGKKPAIRSVPRGPHACQAGLWDRSGRQLGYRPSTGLSEGLRMLAESMGRRTSRPPGLRQEGIRP
jgi:UDP-glucose 4-epimerase